LQSLTLVHRIDEAQKARIALDKFTVNAVVREFMHLDPSTRFQVAKNAFVRELTDAKVNPNVSESQCAWCQRVSFCLPRLPETRR
jgi:predicted RecB family nuclease